MWGKHARQSSLGTFLCEHRGYLLAFLASISGPLNRSLIYNGDPILFVTHRPIPLPIPQVVSHPYHNRTKTSLLKINIYLKTLPSAHGYSLPSTVMGLSHDHWSLTNSLSSALVGSSLVNS
jgi:hypothetical protein